MRCLNFEDQICPIPLLQSKLWLKQAQQGEQLKLWLADPGSCRDIPKYFQGLGHEVKIEQNSQQFCVTITVHMLKD
ncbi:MULTISPECIES: sulfurtransferase TusA family protein [unclassified Agarivorans]|uniref:sulfurtransferase TusA family protein n=1 Tax=unclassified Agarivorans TaxID=2636026 RepID=UPI003D7F0555